MKGEKERERERSLTREGINSDAKQKALTKGRERQGYVERGQKKSVRDGGRRTGGG